MKILIADDHAIVRKGLANILNDEFAELELGEACNSIETISRARKNNWDLILLDISMPGRSGLETLKQMRVDGIKVPILMLSMHPEDQYALRVLKAGASGFVNKDAATEELIKAVHKVMTGRKYISTATADKLAESMDNNGEMPSHENLSDRELQVLELIGSGKTVSEIGIELSLCVNTISTYRARILEKLQLKNNAALTRYALDHVLV
jgi:DNA-binding NarL/FixJ family response regulator